MKFKVMFLIGIFTMSSSVMASEGLLTFASSHSVAETTDRLVVALKRKQMKIFSRIDHAASAKALGLDLRPTELVIFGNPKIGSKLMQCGQTVAIELPMKALVWQNSDGKVQVGFNAPTYLKQRHGLAECDGILEKVSAALTHFGKTATAP